MNTPVSLEMISSIPSDNEGLLKFVAMLTEAVRQSNTGQQLAQMPRWKGFRESESLDIWVAALGQSGIIGPHQEYFTSFVLKLLQPNIDQPISQPDRPHQSNQLGQPTEGGLTNIEDSRILTEEFFGLILVAAVYHDIGEAIIGDISAIRKAEKDEAAEYAAAMELIERVFSEYGIFSDSLIKRLKTIYLKVVAGKESDPNSLRNDQHATEAIFLNSIFKAIERLEYLDTTINCFRSDQEGKGIKFAKVMVARVLALTVPKILNSARIYPTIIGSYLLDNQQVISEMYSQLDGYFQSPEFLAVASNDEKSDFYPVAEKFIEARKQWNIWKQENSISDDQIGIEELS